MYLVIAEKPSVGKAIADVMGAKTRRDGHYEGNGYIISWCVGHLVTLAEPDEYDKRYSKWRYEDLPIIPKNWKFTAVDRTKKQLKVLTELMKNPDVAAIINACDAGREGELIFRLVYNHCACKKPIKRLWISSMEESAISEGFRNLRPGTEYDSLYHAALCRKQADWLVGLNYTRLFTTLFNTKLNVGRVQTPTLAMIVEREQKIKGFVKEPFYIVEATGSGLTADREKVKDKAVAEVIHANCDGNIAVISSIKRQEKSIAAPRLFDLTTLQREANRLFGYTAAQTLNCVQKLYELKISTYPRTDSKFLTEDMAASIPSLAEDVADILPFSVEIGIINPAQVVNNDKVTDHHAIIPTAALLKEHLSSLKSDEKNIILMICARFIAAVSERHVYAETVITLECNGESFTAKGKSIKQIGWKAIEQAFLSSISKNTRDEDKPLPELREGQRFVINTAVREGFSQPPKHFTEDLLLSAMEAAGAEDMPDDAERKGIGTPATRSITIEGLVDSGLIERKDKLLLPTEKGFNLIKILPESVKSPRLTAEWEGHFKRIERGEMTAHDFMVAINSYINDTVQTHNSVSDGNKALFQPDKPSGEVIGKCPRCNNNITESAKGFFCDNKACKFAFWKDNKYFTLKKKTITKEIAKALLKDGSVFLSGLMSEKTGKPYSATILLKDSGEGYPGFEMVFENKK